MWQERQKRYERGNTGLKQRRLLRTGNTVLGENLLEISTGRDIKGLARGSIGQLAVSALSPRVAVTRKSERIS